MAIKAPQLVLMTSLFLLIISINCNESPSNCKLFNFGDSNTDTGTQCFDPNIQSFRYGPLCRPSDGLLYIDYLCEMLGIDLLVPYKNPTSDFTSGANFAIYGETIKESLSIEVDQFEQFQKRTYKTLLSKGKGPTIIKDVFRNAIFSIDMGQNDCYRFVQNSSFGNIPSFIEGIENATKKLYQLGGRKFLLYNTGPLGSLPMVIGERRTYIYDIVARDFNGGLSSLSVKLRSILKDATIIYMDMYNIKQDIIANSSKYGLESASVPCKGQTTSVCHSVFWDIAHYSDVANKIVASRIWTGDFSVPHIKIKDLCDMMIKE